MDKLSLNEKSIHTFQSHEMTMHLHVKALACSCECLGMISENELCSINGVSPTYSSRDFRLAMQKWGLIDKEENPTI